MNPDDMVTTLKVATETLASPHLVEFLGAVAARIELTKDFDSMSERVNQLQAERQQLIERLEKSRTNNSEMQQLMNERWKRKPLTDDEVGLAFKQTKHHMAFARLIEAAHGIGERD